METVATSSVSVFCSSKSGGFQIWLIPCWIHNYRIQFLIFDLAEKCHQIVCALKHKQDVLCYPGSQPPLFRDQQHQWSVHGLKIINISLVLEDEEQPGKERSLHFCQLLTWGEYFCLFPATQFIDVCPLLKCGGNFQRLRDNRQALRSQIIILICYFLYSLYMSLILSALLMSSVHGVFPSFFLVWRNGIL